jgi:N-methylhydantoinase B
MTDFITLTVLQNRFRQIAEEMDVIFDRAAFSPIISEGRDRASGIYTAEDGSLIAQGTTGMPIHIGAMQFGVSSIARKHGKTCRPGDIFILNDPYMGGTHLMDVKLVMPVFVEGELFCFLGSSGHWPDIGGAVPGGYVTYATEIQQEGVRLGGIRLYRDGEVDENVLQVILDNVRVPAQRLGDLQAQVASLRAGEDDLRRVVAHYGATTLKTVIGELRQQAARLVRERIRTIKPGVYSFEDAMDNDGIDDEQLWVRLDMHVESDRMVFDFSRSSPPCKGPLNSVYATTASAVYIAFKHMFPEIQMNAGCFEPLKVIAPTSTFLNAEYPRPVSGCAAEVSQRVVDTCFGALGQAIPGRATGAPVGTSLNVAIGGYDPEEDRRYIFYFYTGGGHGGNSSGDGISNACTSVGLAKTPTLEAVEQHAPILFEHYALREDSGGAGQYRGGLGVSYSLRLLRGDAYLSVLGDRNKRGPFGVNGGQSGASTEISLSLQGKPYLPKLATKEGNILFRSGDVLNVETPGGGGYGRPEERTGELIRNDLKRGHVSSAFTRKHYGAVTG